MNTIDYISKEHINYSNEIDVNTYRYIKLEKLKAQVILDNITDVIGINNEQ